SPAASVAASPEGSIHSSQLRQVMETMLKMNEKLVDSLKERSSSALSYLKFPDLPIFEGKIAEWPLFKAELEQSTAQWRIQDVENIGRLRKCLKGDARDAVLSLMVHPNNMPEILRTLERRFGRADVIIEDMVEQIKKLLHLRER